MGKKFISSKKKMVANRAKTLPIKIKQTGRAQTN